MGNWHEDVLFVDPRTGESSDSRDDNSPAACAQRLRSIEAARRIRAGDTEAAMKLLAGEDPEGWELPRAVRGRRLAEGPPHRPTAPPPHRPS